MILLQKNTTVDLTLCPPPATAVLMRGSSVPVPSSWLASSMRAMRGGRHAGAGMRRRGAGLVGPGRLRGRARGCEECVERGDAEGVEESHELELQIAQGGDGAHRGVGADEGVDDRLHGARGVPARARARGREAPVGVRRARGLTIELTAAGGRARQAQRQPTNARSNRTGATARRAHNSSRRRSHPHTHLQVPQVAEARHADRRPQAKVLELRHARALAEAGEDGRKGGVATAGDVALDQLQARAVDAGDALRRPDLRRVGNHWRTRPPRPRRMWVRVPPRHRPAAAPGAQHSCAARTPWRAGALSARVLALSPRVWRQKEKKKYSSDWCGLIEKGRPTCGKSRNPHPLRSLGAKVTLGRIFRLENAAVFRTKFRGVFLSQK